MNRTRIEGVVNADGSQGYALNHFVGCKRGCPYCWASKGLRRSMMMLRSSVCLNCQTFFPHWHPERLVDFKKLKGANTVAVGWMGDIWAYSGLTDPLWIDMMHPLIVASHRRRNKLLFLTRNPKGYRDAEKAYRFGPKAWLGVTVTCQEDVDQIGPDFAAVDHPNKFVSYEPMLGEIRDWGKLGGFGWLYMGNLTDGRGKVLESHPNWFIADVIKAGRKVGARVWTKDTILDPRMRVKETPWLK